MARLALPNGWASALARQRGPLRTYQWLWLLLCTAGALLTAAPRILAQPVIFTTSASVAADARHRGGLFTAQQPNADYYAVESIAIELLRALSDGTSPRYPTLGSPTLGARYEPQADGSIRVTAVAPTPEQAQRLADDAAEAMARSIRAAGGREVFRVLTGSYLVNALEQGAPPSTSFEAQLRTIFLNSAFPLSKPPAPDTRRITLEQLDAETRSDLARALEVRDVELSTVDLPALQARIRAAGLNCRAELAARGDQAAADCQTETHLITGLDAIRRALQLLNAPFDPAQQSGVYRSAAAPTGGEIPRYTAPLLALAAIVGLVFGGAGVAVDRSAGVMRKVRELWAYRELIINLVLRDMRVRYKGSALGYLWTQLAPLLLMLVFWFVFSRLLSSTISMFPVFLIIGLLAWNFTNEAVVGGARSIIDSASLIKKVFFPREVLPLVSVLSSLLNFLLSLPMMLLLMAAVQLGTLGRLNFAWTIAYLPVLLVIQTMLLTGLALLMSALAVRFRDFVHLIGILMQFWFFLTPVVYAIESFNSTVFGIPLAVAIRWLNPMASLIEFYREVLYGQAVSVPNIPTPGLPALTSVLRVLVTAVSILALGYWFFQRRSGSFGEDI